MLRHCTLPLLCWTALALAGCIEGLPAEAGDGGVDQAVADHSHEGEVMDALPPGDVYFVGPHDLWGPGGHDLSSIAELVAALEGFSQAVSDAGITLCPCLTNLESPPCIAQPSQCFADEPICAARWTFSQTSQSCVLEALTPQASLAVTAFQCMGTAAETLESCVGVVQCTELIFACVDAYDQASVSCMTPLGVGALNDALSCLNR